MATSTNFHSLSARRLLLLGGIGLILVGMVFGDIFAVFILHQNAARVGEGLSSAAHAALAGDAGRIPAIFQNIGSFLENRGSKVDTHVHMIDFGYLALLLALLQPWVGLSDRAKRRWAWLFLFGGGLLPICVFLIHYVGLAHSPLASIGWASIFADLGGLLALVVTLAFLVGLVRHFRSSGREAVRDDLLAERSFAGRLLLTAGIFLVLIGFIHGAYYAAFDLYRHEALDFTTLREMTFAATQGQSSAVENSLPAYGQLQGDKAVKIAAHAHIIEFGLLAMLLGLFQPYVYLNERWKRRWAWLLLAGSLLLPGCVLLELNYGLLAGGLADAGGLLVIVALLAMWIGVLRYTGRLDAEAQ
ncbi:MAG TPA: hypothetical protein VHA33_14120 [Candidatus Angelobacter sp.]|jgi:hypothetical protein|nr:hypothetical protein [Candidatus Angelobacter sp.]